MKYLNLLLLLIPAVIVMEFTHANEAYIFAASLLSIVPLAAIIGKATEELSIHTGPRIGGLLNATLGNAAELIITIFALKAGLISIVKASIAGSILGNILLVLGLSAFIGGLKYERLQFNCYVSNLNTSLLLMIIISLSVPAIFSISGHIEPDRLQTLSLWTAVGLLLIYVASMLFSFKTHKHLFHVEHEGQNFEWGLKKSVTVLFFSVAAVVVMSEILVETIEPATKALGLSELFVGLILIPIVGNAAEHSAAIIMALKNKMNIALEIAVGSSVQIALFVAPVLVFLGYAFGHPMNLLFNPLEIACIILAIVVVNNIVRDSETDYLEGLILFVTYILISIGFFLI
ncbi:calcium/proton antiporter [Desulfocucumis palustris]|uniref:Ca(2+)/H(+) antiporter n=1 Tax=Desulfocucumis palustris TaxID=1898651 RepID=A0A2L2X8X8_9FIRM|nr:calcium/proton exchanger [Desulfocucumis palustris]GBF32645.1 calcium/proton antiporter [Desulfocucumis palustris]